MVRRCAGRRGRPAVAVASVVGVGRLLERRRLTMWVGRWLRSVLLLHAVVHCDAANCDKQIVVNYKHDCRPTQSCTPTAQGWAGSPGSNRIERQFGLCRIPGRFALYGVMIARDAVFVYTCCGITAAYREAPDNYKQSHANSCRSVPCGCLSGPKITCSKRGKTGKAARVTGQFIGV